MHELLAAKLIEYEVDISAMTYKISAYIQLFNKQMLED